ncbi:MAG: hypothetical protein AAF035_11335 [Pseudomonadota bacterium]
MSTVIDPFEILNRAIRDAERAQTEGRSLSAVWALNDVLRQLTPATPTGNPASCPFFDGNALGCTKAGACECKEMRDG